HRAMYWAARVTEGTGDDAGASRRYADLASTAYGPFTEEAAFRAGYVLYKAGDTAGALAAWDAVEGSATARLEYWRGRALEQIGDQTAATAAFERAVALGPLDLHGMEAARELGRAGAF